MMQDEGRNLSKCSKACKPLQLHIQKFMHKEQFAAV